MGLLQQEKLRLRLHLETLGDLKELAEQATDGNLVEPAIPRSARRSSGRLA